MFKNHVYGIDLGSNMIKIYSQNSNEILKEKNMIAIRNKDTVLAVGDEAYEIYEKNPTNVKYLDGSGGKTVIIVKTDG